TWGRPAEQELRDRLANQQATRDNVEQSAPRASIAMVDLLIADQRGLPFRVSRVYFPPQSERWLQHSHDRAGVASLDSLKPRIGPWIVTRTDSESGARRRHWRERPNEGPPQAGWIERRISPSEVLDAVQSHIGWRSTRGSQMTHAARSPSRPREFQRL